jgi:hypothetical protein
VYKIILWHSFFMSEINPNWQLLVDEGAHIESATSGHTVRLLHSNSERVIEIAHKLSFALEATEEFPLPHQSMERTLRDMRSRIADRRSRIFGETRPARANFAVRVDDMKPEGFLLYADVRNAYELKPELGGHLLLQASFNEVIETLCIES